VTNVDPPEDPDLLKALLASAREERDENYRQLIESQEWINSVLANPAYRAARSVARLVTGRRGTAATPQSPRIPPPRDHLPLPDTDAVLIDATALDESMRSGIARVTTRAFEELFRTTGGRAQLVFPVAGRLRRDPRLEEELLSARPDVSGAGGISGQSGPETSPTGLFSASIAPGPVADSWWQAVSDYRGRGGKYVQVVHDLLPITVPEFFDLNMRDYFPQWLRRVTAQADAILTDSQATTDDLQRWWATVGYSRPAPAVSVLPLGSEVSTAVTPRPRESSTHADDSTRGAIPGLSREEAKQVLIVGTIEPRKGVDAVLAAVDEITGSSPPVHITFVGTRGWISPAILSGLERTVATNPSVRWLQRVDDVELAQLYQDADLLLAPSRGEGYGLPIVEAMQHGVPVLARDLPVFREIGGDAARYFAADADIADAVRVALANPIRPQSPQELPTWASTAAVILETLARPADSGRY